VIRHRQPDSSEHRSPSSYRRLRIIMRTHHHAYFAANGLQLSARRKSGLMKAINPRPDM
jgi:hypothetical protein